MLQISNLKVFTSNKLRQFYFLAERKFTTLVQTNKIG